MQPGEADWHERRIRAHTRGADDVTGWDIDTGVPGHKPAFQQFIAGHDGSIRTVRAGPGRRLPDCAETAVEASEFRDRPCWKDSYLIDIFDAEGRYVGDVEVPEEFYIRQSPVLDFEPYLEAGVLLTHVEDDFGTIMVKRYRIVPPKPPG